MLRTVSALLLLLVCAPDALAQEVQDYAGTYTLWPQQAGAPWSTLKVSVEGGRATVVRLSPPAERLTATRVRVEDGTLIAVFDGQARGATGALEGRGRSEATVGRYRLCPQGLRVRELLSRSGGQCSKASGLRQAGATLEPGRVTTVVSHGHPGDRYDLVILADRYEPSRLQAFREHAALVVRALRDETPYREYWGHLNVHLIESTQDLGIRPTSDPSAYPELDPPKIWAAAQRAPGCDAALVLSDAEFRSLASTTDERCAVVSTRGAVSLDRVAIHELAHAIAWLSDEYVGGGSLHCDGSRYERRLAADLERRSPSTNVTLHTDRDRIPWRHWIPKGTPLPTPHGEGHRVGLFEGAYTCSEGWFRPSPTCLMRDAGESACVVCREAIVLALGEAVTPFAVERERVSKHRWILRARLTAPLPDAHRFEWFFRGRRIARGATLVFDRPPPSLGKNLLECVLVDQTPWVRKQPLEHRVGFKVRRPFMGKRFDVEPLP